MNLFPESMNLFPETFYTYGQIPSGLGGAILRQPQGLAGVAEDFVNATGGLQPGQTITRDMIKWLWTSGAYLDPNLPADSILKDESTWDWWLSDMGGSGPYGGPQGIINHYTALALRYTAQKNADAEYAAYIAARTQAAQEAQQYMEFDSTGRLTDAGAAAANAYVEQATADELAAVNAAQASVEATRAAVEQFIASNVNVVEQKPTYTDAEIASIVQDELMNKGNTPGAVVALLVNQYGIDNDKANRVVNAEFSVLATEWAAMQAAAQTAAANAAAQAQAAAQAAADQQAAIDVFNRLRQQQTESDAMRELEKAQTAAARNFPWFEADMFVNATAQQKAAAYLRYIDMGKNASEIRSAAEAFFGKQRDEDWQLLQEMARQIAIDRAGPIKVTEPPRREEVIPQLATQPAGNAGAIALAALAAALLLGA